MQHPSTRVLPRYANGVVAFAYAVINGRNAQCAYQQRDAEERRYFIRYILEPLEHNRIVALPREHLHRVFQKIRDGQLHAVREVELALLSCREVW